MFANEIPVQIYNILLKEPMVRLFLVIGAAILLDIIIVVIMRMF